MAADPASAPPLGFTLKSAQLPLVAVVLRSADMQAVLPELERHLGDDPDFFDSDPVLIDLSAVQERAPPIDFGALVQALRSCRAAPVAVRGGSPAQMRAARAAGLAAAPLGLPPAAPTVVEVVREVPAPLAQTMVVERQLRSGQSLYARGGDIVLLAAVNYGAEVMADGNIHVYAPLRGKAVAGAGGHTGARIFSTCMQAQTLSIAGVHHSGDFVDAVAGKSAQARLEGSTVVVEAL